MATTVSDFLVSRLAEWGVRRIFGYPGDGINGVMGALQRSKTAPEFIQARHEEMAAFMACGHAKFTGEVGVCLATSGPGAIHLLNGLYDAKADHVPVLALVGQAATTALGSRYQQEVDLEGLFKDVASAYCQTASNPVQVRHLVDQAMRTAQARRAVTCLILPKDVQELVAVPIPPHAHNTTLSGITSPPPAALPDPGALARAASILNAGKRVAILVGAGALGARDEVVATAELLGAGVAKALLGKAVVEDDLPFVTGAVGLLGTRPSSELMRRCDTLLMVGSSFPYSEFLPKEGQARGVQIDVDGTAIGLRFPIEVGLVGDARVTLQALMALLEPKEDRAFRRDVESWIRDWWSLLEERAMIPAKPLNPQRVFWDLSPRLPDDAILCADSGSVCDWYARDLKLRRGMMASVSGGLASMGCAVPYAIAAKFAYPDRVVFALAGDGAMQMNGLAELLTVAKYWRTWKDPRLIVVVLNNRDLNLVTWEMRALEGNPRFAASQDIPDFPYAQFAEMVGFRGIRVASPESLPSAFGAALTADRPVVIEAVVDPDVAPLPPHVSLEQAKNFALSIAKGDAASAGVLSQVFHGLIKK